MATTETKEHMSPDLIDRYWKKFFQANPLQANAYGEEALKWFQKRVSKDLNVQAKHIINNSDDTYKRKTAKQTISGKLYLFEYEAEEAGHAETGTYDRYPMVFFFDSFKSKEGKQVLLGLNVHYLTPQQRATLYVALLKLKNTKGLTERTKLRLEWETIKAAAGSKIAEAAIHAYRADRFKSRVVEVDPTDWIICVFLRLERWIKLKTHSLEVQSYVRRSLHRK